MNADLERLIALQKLDTAARDAERRLAEEPEREKTLAGRLEAARLSLASAKERVAGFEGRKDHRIPFAPRGVYGSGAGCFKSDGFGALKGRDEVIEFLVGANLVVKMVAGGSHLAAGQ